MAQPLAMTHGEMSLRHGILMLLCSRDALVESLQANRQAAPSQSSVLRPRVACAIRCCLLKAVMVHEMLRAVAGTAARNRAGKVASGPHLGAIALLDDALLYELRDQGRQLRIVKGLSSLLQLDSMTHET